MSSQALYTNKAPDLGSGEGIDAFAPGHAAPPYLLADPHPGAKKPITLALQGGGAWGAYTWGVLDALLASRQVTIDQISGTSAGAINGAIVVSALAGGPAGASLRSGRAPHARRSPRSGVRWPPPAQRLFCGNRGRNPSPRR